MKGKNKISYKITLSVSYKEINLINTLWINAFVKNVLCSLYKKVAVKLILWGKV